MHHDPVPDRLKEVLSEHEDAGRIESVDAWEGYFRAAFENVQEGTEGNTPEDVLDELHEQTTAALREEKARLEGKGERLRSERDRLRGEAERLEREQGRREKRTAWKQRGHSITTIAERLPDDVPKGDRRDVAKEIAAEHERFVAALNAAEAYGASEETEAEADPEKLLHAESAAGSLSRRYGVRPRPADAVFSRNERFNAAGARDPEGAFVSPAAYDAAKRRLQQQ